MQLVRNANCAAHLLTHRFCLFSFFWSFFRYVHVLQTYGDAAKTKTISRRKAERIGRILRGHDRSNGADSSKFRFWVRAKGFRLGPPGSSTSTSSSSSSSSLSTSSSNSSSTVASPSGNGGGDDEADDDAAAADDDAAAAAAADRSVIDDLYVVTSTAKVSDQCII